MSHSVLLIEDNMLVSLGLQNILRDEGFEVAAAETGAAAKELLEKQPYDIILIDMRLPDMTGSDLFKEWHDKHPDSIFIFVTGHATVEMAVETLKAGAYDFLAKPIERPQLVKTLRKAVEHIGLKRKVDQLSQLSARMTDTIVMGDIVAIDPISVRLMEMATRIAKSEYTSVLITGESGTGKGVLARYLHKMGKRADQPFVELNSSAIPAHLIESELFGHVKGSFTDAKSDRTGLFEMADNGTLFLDEIGDMDVGLQSKLLKAMEDQRFRRIGGTKEIKVDVAIIAATNQNLDQQIEDGTFRADLFYRLNVLPLRLPPLRERPQDIEQLCYYFLSIYSRKVGRPIKGFSNCIMQALKAYSWPGNIRELRNVVERGCILSAGDTIEDLDLLFPSGTLGLETQTSASDDPEAFSHMDSVMPLEEAERKMIEAAMKQTEGNRNEAARLLGIHRTTLYKKLQTYDIDA